MELFNSINVIYFLLYVTCIWLQYVPSSHAWKNLQRPQLGTHILSLNVLKHRNIHRLHSSEGDDDYGKPSVIPFDGPGTFAREDVLAPDLKKAIEKLKKAKNDLNNESNADTSNEKKPSEPSIQSQRRPSRTDDLSYIDDRPTGYDNITDEEDDDVPSYMPSDDPYIIRALKDIYIGSPYDSNPRKQARFVVRNITGFSLAIGIIFTVVWYAFPGQFISFRGGAEDFAVKTQRRYSASYVDPDDLLNAEVASPDWEYFEEFSSVGKPSSSNTEESKPSSVTSSSDKSVDL